MSEERDIALDLKIGHLEASLDRSLASLRSDPSRVMSSRSVVERALEDGRAYYGINTGFGSLKSVRIPDADLGRLQRNLLVSHAVGVGPAIPRAVTRLMLRLKIHALGLGYSGVSWPVMERLLAWDEQGLTPVVPSRGSVGASGDLAPLAHMALPLLGLGEFWGAGDADAGADIHADADPFGIPAGVVMERLGWAPVELSPKDGLALINGTQMMSAYGAYLLERSVDLAILADVAAAMSLEALQGSVAPFDPRAHRIRPHPGQGTVAANVRALLAESEILESHRDCGKVQDPYSLRCVPQVHGAGRDALDHAVRVVDVEINSVTDNPLVFPDGDILSCGNFHGQPLALALDFAAIALAEYGGISERRIALLLEGHDGLPRLLMRETGLNSGFMIPQYTAAALVSENKILGHPASVDSIPTSLGQEDHVSMGSVSALKLAQVYRNVEYILALEFLTAAQALDYRAPLRPGRGVAIAHRIIRSRVEHREYDASFQADLREVLALLPASAAANSSRGTGLLAMLRNQGFALQ